MANTEQAADNRTGTPPPLDRRHQRLVRGAGLASFTAALLLIGLKVWAYVATDSIALLSSLADSLLDAFASLITLLAVRFALEPADREHRFGHGKLEAIASLMQAVIITGSAGYVAYRAVGRLIEPAPIEAPAVGMTVMVVSLIITVALVALQRFVVHHTESIAIRADSMHYEADIMTNIAILIAIGLNAALGWNIVDPLLGLVVTGLILNSVRQILTQSMDVLLDRELTRDVRRRIVDIARAHPAVLGVHDLRTRQAGVDTFIQLHLELDPQLTIDVAHRISDEVEDALHEELPRAEILIHFDPYGFAEPRDEF